MSVKDLRVQMLESSEYIVLTGIQMKQLINYSQIKFLNF